jgi:hypothetical protein
MGMVERRGGCSVRSACEVLRLALRTAALRHTVVTAVDNICPHHCAPLPVCTVLPALL